MSRYYKLHLHNVKLLQTSSSPYQHITNFIFTMSSYYKLPLHNVKLLQTSSSQCQDITNFIFTMSRYYKLHLHNVKLLKTSSSPYQDITNFIFTMSSYYKLHFYNVKLLRTSFLQCQAITNFIFTMSSYYKRHLHNVKLLQTSSLQCQAITNCILTMSRYYKLHLHNVKLLQTSSSQCQDIINSIFTMSSYYKLHLHNVNILQTSSSQCQAITNFIYWLLLYKTSSCQHQTSDERETGLLLILQVNIRLYISYCVVNIRLYVSYFVDNIRLFMYRILLTQCIENIGWGHYPLGIVSTLRLRTLNMRFFFSLSLAIVAFLAHYNNAALRAANPSRNGEIPIFEANQLKAVATVYTIGVQKLSGVDYNVNELQQISTSGNQVDIPANNNVNQQVTVLLNEFDKIANLGCGGSVVTGPSVSNSVCDECAAENGVGYVTYRNSAGVVDGRYFIQCKREDFGNGFIANVLRCPDSLFWHDDLKNCVGLISSDNYEGQCDSGTYVFASVSCGAYFNCTDGQVRSQCCPDNTGFDPVQKRCVTDPTCKFHCSDPSLSRAANCDKEPVIMQTGQVNPCKFKWIVSPSVSYEMPCAVGTNFNQTACSCTIHSNGTCPGVYNDPCDPDVNVNFNNNKVVDTRGSTVVNKGGAAVNNGIATFNGQNRQRVQFMRYTNNDFTLPLAIKIKYRDTESKQNMALVATGDCLSKPGLYVLVGNSQVTLGLHTESQGYSTKYETSTNAPGLNQWKEVVFHFDGSVLQGEVRTLDSNGNSIVNRSPIPPRTVSSGAGVRILETEGAMVLGYAHDSGYPGFVGDVDEFTVWRGCKAKASPSEY
ncbi:hypothetical protein LOTGIDRAFT_235132 [Lottia gigantea]|uniref:Chitin-binding type-2 domain-containing protein n=1 Tax=Lottia gigantea TaxID=225164 RepID=V4BDS1_LOTGI|nr:hypothetical protein LOTGIDRAFT_235132 [Lottia gigantea]ESO86924.1 hypothetical protein LOTGIDRAFT_235132 [Lottia gigantea]